MSGTQAIEGAKRSVLFTVDPSTDVALQGIDYASGAEDVCYNPRNQEPVDEALVESIMRLGVLEPVGVVKNLGRIVVLFGNQRVRAAREANRRLKAAGKEPIRVPCMTPVRGATEAELGEMALAENEHRQETGPLAKAEMAAIQLRRCGNDIGTAAKAFRLSDQGFRNLLKLREAPEAVKELVREGKVSATAAIELADVPVEKLAEVVKGFGDGGGTVEKAKDARKKAQGTRKTGRPSIALLKDLAGSEDAKQEMMLTIGEVDNRFADGFFECVQWIIGELTANDVDGLTSALEALDGLRSTDTRTDAEKEKDAEEGAENADA